MEYTYNKKHTICILLITLFFTYSCSGQQQKDISKKQETLKNTDSIETIISEIRKEYIKINTDSSRYKLIQKDLNGESAEGGLLKKYFYNDTMQKASTIFFGETGKLTLDYYFKKGKIIFIYEREDRYNVPIYGNKSKVGATKENRYYFNGQHLIRWIGDDGKIKGTKYYAAKESEIFKDLKDIE